MGRTIAPPPGTIWLIDDSVEDIHKKWAEKEGFSWVKIIVRVRENATGIERESHENDLIKQGEDFPSVFNWEENNYSCDCNRRSIFKRAGGEDGPDDDENVCSYGLFSVSLANEATGVVYYTELEEGGNG